MNIKKTVKKMTAVFTGATMLGATVMGAMAMDLGDFPAPIIQDGEWDGRIVIGANAGSTLDVAGATEIGAKLPELGKVPVSVGGGEITIEGGYDFENEELNAPFEVDAPLDNGDISTLREYDLDWDEEDVAVSEQLVLEEGALEVVTSIGNGNFEEYGIDSYLNVPSIEKIKYQLVFEDFVNASEIDDADELKLEFEFLGKEMLVTSMDDDTMTLETSSSNMMTQGETWEVDGKTIEIVSIYENGVLIEVDGDRTAISEEETVDANGLDVTLEEHAWIDIDHEYNFVELKAGADLTRDVDLFDSLVEFGEPEDDAEAEWIWYWNVSEDGTLNYIEARNNLARTLTEDEVEYADERPALAYGESLMFPNDYLAIVFDGYVDSSSNEVDLSFRSLRLENSTERTGEEDFLVISSDSDRSPFNVEGISADSIFIADITADNFSVGYDDDGDRVWFGDEGLADSYVDEVLVELDRGQEDVKILPSGTADVLLFQFGDENLTFEVNSDYDEFVDETGLKYNGETDVYNEYGVRLSYGVTFENAEKMIDDDDRFVMNVPHEAAEPVVYVAGEDTNVMDSGSGIGYQYPVAPEAVMLLDTDALSRIGSLPMIIVGGPNANTVAAELLDVEQFGEEVGEMFSPNRAMIRLFEDQNAILVAGYDAKDTYAASLALANFDKADFEGYSEVELTIPASTVTSIVGAN